VLLLPLLPLPVPLQHLPCTSSAAAAANAADAAYAALRCALLRKQWASASIRLATASTATAAAATTTTAAAATTIRRGHEQAGGDCAREASGKHAGYCK
jgi:hypothetical protein